jgi:hypothetical protein
LETNYKERGIMSDVAIRAIKTFIQTFLATVAVGVATVQDANSAKALVIAGVAAAISAAWNAIIKTA